MEGDFDIKKFIKLLLAYASDCFELQFYNANSFYFLNVASKCMYITLFVKCKNSFQSFQHANKQFFLEYVTGFWHTKAVHAQD